MKWKSSDYDCRNWFVNTLREIINEPDKWGFSDIFDYIDEIWELPELINEKFSDPIIKILNFAKSINRNKPKKEILKDLKRIYEDLKDLEM